jgi:tetratricopeptide (TPR) repeat protein
MASHSSSDSHEGGPASKASAAAFLQMDQLDFEIDFYQAIIDRTPTNIDALRILGNHYTSKGHYTRGLKIDKRLVHLAPDDPIVWYNLACSYALLLLTDLALDALEKGVELGYTELAHMQADTDLNSIRDEPRYAAVVRQLQRAP